MRINRIVKTGCMMAVVALFFIQTEGFSQHTVSGTVTDGSTAETLPGVNILVKGTSVGASTNADGFYELNAPSASDTLIFSFVGYQTREVPVNGRSEIDINLQQRTMMGEDIIVIGYGTQRKEELTSAVSSINSEEFTKASVRDAAALVKGKIPGLIVTEPSGDPTAGSEISLRGITTLNAPTNPLILIDGIPGDLNTVATENIESISVLKSGSAAAIYGSRGSNGVILINTKKHSGGMPTTIQYDGFLNLQTINNKLDLLKAEDVRNYIDQGFDALTDHGYGTNWQDQILRNPVSQRHNLRFSGGNSSTNYSASVNYRNAQGIILRSETDQVTGQINVGHSMFEGKLQADLNLISRIENDFNAFVNDDGNNNVWRQTIKRNPTDRVTNDQGEWAQRVASDYYNPLALIHEANGEDEDKLMRLSGTLTWSPVENLTLELLGSSQKETGSNSYAESFQHSSTTMLGVNGYASRGASSSSDQLLEFTGTFQETYGTHDFTVLGGYSYQDVTFDNFTVSNSNFPTDLFGSSSLESGLDLTEGRANMNSGKSSYKLIGFFSRLNYDWDDRFILMGSIRYEGNSKFGSDHKWGIFPAVSAGWRLTEESFMENLDFLTDFKVRAGFGVTGIAPGNSYQSLASFSYGDRMYNNGEWVQGLSPSRNANPDLRWERKEEINVGFDFSMLESRLSGSLDIYRRDTRDMLWNYSVPVPPFLYNTILANVGQIRNNGIEALLEYNVIQERDLRWTTSVNYSTNANKLVTLSNELYETENDYFDTGYTGDPIQLPTHRVEIGGPIGNFFGYESVDIDENGEWIVLNSEGDRIPIADANPDDRRYLGNGIPNHNLGWNNTLRYKNIDLNVNLHGAFGFQILNSPRMFMENPTAVEYNVLESAFHDVYGKQPLDYSLAYTSYYVEDGDYLKINNITLGYTFGVETLDFVSNARLYVSGRNLYTFTGYDGIDPEVSSNGLIPGVDPRNKYPTTRTFTLGLNLTF